jgi:hypothetical protein
VTLGIGYLPASFALNYYVSSRSPKMVNDKQKKTPPAPISLERFTEKAKALTVVVNGVPMAAIPKTPFSTGSFGWNTAQRGTIEVDGVYLPVQIGLNITVIGSKPEPKK